VRLVGVQLEQPLDLRGVHWVGLDNAAPVDADAPQAEDAAAGWASICRPDDPWLKEVEAIRNAGKVLLVAEQRENAFAEGTPRPTIDQADLDVIESSLRRVETEGAPVRRVYYLATRALKVLDGPLWRNRPDRVKETDEDWARKRVG
jgi:hypothetical protein